MSKTINNILIQFDNIVFGYKPETTILKGISFSLKRHEYVCIIGANGCGKSTLGKIIVGLLKPRLGSIIFNDKLVDKTNISQLRKSAGIILENPDNQFIGLSVQDDIAFGLENQCVPRDKMQGIIDETSKFVGTYELLKATPQSLSGGQKQLVAITSVLAMKPELIVFDEATSMLDAKSKNAINKLMLSLKDSKTIVSITHDMEEAAKADRIIVMNKGKIVLTGTPKQIFSNPMLSKLSLDVPFDWKLNQRINYEK